MSEQRQEQSARQGQSAGQGQGQGQRQGRSEVREQGQQGQQNPAEAPTQGPRKDAAVKARLVFRDPLDEQSRDDTDAGWGDRPGAGGGRGLDWYLSQRPPHHGG
ncbi:hypothetical protein [Streptomyces sp. NRRL S-350]|uniref:hypothetical protein n=1 Tax=Streptomyces sp. NRRL S-350 TaxID=1463902 RepID=UPI001F1C6E0B|nr:hypothetical protein [Streptomyces sp. NRRL S-350]